MTKTRMIEIDNRSFLFFFVHKHNTCACSWR
jgi:hypothetical protein